MSKKLDQKAMPIARQYLEFSGYSVEDLSSDDERKGYDLIAHRGREGLTIAVKGCSRLWKVTDLCPRKLIQGDASSQTSSASRTSRPVKTRNSASSQEKPSTRTPHPGFPPPHQRKDQEGILPETLPPRHLAEGPHSGRTC